MRHILDLERWPLDELGGAKGEALVAHCRKELRDAGLFNLDALIRPDALETSVADVAPVLDAAALPTPGITTSTLTTRSKALRRTTRPSGGSRPSTTRSAGTRSREASSPGSTRGSRSSTSWRR